MRKVLTLLLFVLTIGRLQAQICDTGGNLVIYSNYDGGILTINVDQNIPNLKIGICTYEPVQVNITGPFVGNVTQVIYAGFNSAQNNNNCGLGNFPTSVTGVSSSIVTINPAQNPPSVGYTPAHGNGAGPWGGIMIGAAGSCDTTMDAGGVNTPDEIVYYFETATGGTLRFHHTQYACWMNQTLSLSAGGTCCIEPPAAGGNNGCNANGNVVIYSNYDGGILTINCDQNIPNMKVGICTYEAVQVNFVGPFVGNITEVIYAGFDGSNNNCGFNPPTTTITGVSSSIVTMYSQTLGNIAIASYLGEPLAPGFPPLVNCMTGAEGSCNNSNSGGGNSAPQIVQFFLSEFGAGSVLFSHFVQYNCYNGTFNVSDGGNCCLETPTTPPNPIYIGNGDYDFIIPSDTNLCNGPITIDLSAYQVLTQPPTYPGYVWSDGTTGPIITITQPGTYSFYVGDYCHYDPSNWLTDTIVVTACCTQPPAPPTSGNQSYCVGDPLNPITAVPGTNGSITWYSDAALTNVIGSGNSINPSNTVGTTTYYATDTDNGCEGPPSTLTITINPLPTFTVSSSTGSNAICPGSSLVLSSSAATGNTWTGGITTPTLNVTSAGTYNLTVNNGTCSADTSITIISGTAPNASISGPTSVCQNTPFSLTAAGGGTYTWSSGETTSSINTSLSTTTSFTVIVSNGQCTDTASQSVTVLSPSPVNASGSATIVIGGSTTLNATGGSGSYTWSPPDGLSCTTCASPEAGPMQTTTYIVASTSANGCTAYDTVVVIVDIICGEVFVPTAFSPNGNNANETFGPLNICITQLEMKIYNRWGELIFESNDPNTFWDGTFKGENAAAGAYAYTMNLTLINGSTMDLKGSVVLMR
jgi:gliding motility-associated-like protein